MKRVSTAKYPTMNRTSSTEDHLTRAREILREVPLIGEYVLTYIHSRLIGL
jgi:hypothetical protein